MKERVAINLTVRFPFQRQDLRFTVSAMWAEPIARALAALDERKRNQRLMRLGAIALAVGLAAAAFVVVSRRRQLPSS